MEAGATAGQAERRRPGAHGAGLPRVSKPGAPGRRLCARPRCNKARRPSVRGRCDCAGFAALRLTLCARGLPLASGRTGRRRLGRSAQPGLGTARALCASPPSRKGFFFFLSPFPLPAIFRRGLPEDARRGKVRAVCPGSLRRHLGRIVAGQARLGLDTSQALQVGKAAAWLGGRRLPLQSYGPGDDFERLRVTGL